jgi:quinol---cytochrome c reductase iron-sulfur subunit, bacillus type
MQHPCPPPANRRSFLEWTVKGLGALFGAVLGLPVIAYLIDPRNRPARAGEFRSVARFSDLPADGRPVQAVIRDVKRDAWTLYPNEVIGRVWLIRRGEQQVDALTTICPHLGCSVNFDGAKFVCPCHNGTFALSGELIPAEQLGMQNPAPRGMDALEVRRDPGDPEIIQVKYQNFQQGKPTKELKT